VLSGYLRRQRIKEKAPRKGGFFGILARRLADLAQAHRDAHAFSNQLREAACGGPRTPAAPRGSTEPY